MTIEVDDIRTPARILNSAEFNIRGGVHLEKLVEAALTELESLTDESDEIQHED